jgi:hypothetical protein
VDKCLSPSWEVVVYSGSDGAAARSPLGRPTQQHETSRTVDGRPARITPMGSRPHIIQLTPDCPSSDWESRLKAWNSVRSGSLGSGNSPSANSPIRAVALEKRGSLSNPLALRSVNLSVVHVSAG